MTHTTTGADFAATDGQHLAEIDNGDLLTISRGCDGRALVFHGRKLASDFKSSVASHGAARAIATYCRIAPYMAADKGAWGASPYKPGRVPAMIAALSGE